MNFSRSVLFHTETRVFLKYFVRGCSDLICNKIANKITKNSPPNNSETESQTEVKSIEIPKEGYIPPESRKKIIDELRLT